MKIRIQKSQARFKRVRISGGPDEGVGEFFLLLDISAEGNAVYIPLSIASGKKPTGFVYQIEGTGESSIVTTDISVSGKGITQITFGTIAYAKIPAGTEATFRILIEMRGKAGREYGIVIHRVNYKLDPGDARYEKLPTALASRKARFK